MYSLYYMILNDDYSTVHYVGITSKSLKDRLQSHIYQSKNQTYQKGYLQRFLYKYSEISSISLVEIESGLTREEAIQLEIKHIKFLKNSHPLKNTSSGGEIFDESAHMYKKIYQYDLAGNLLNIYNGSTKASSSVNLSSKGKINDCCNGKLRHVKGFVWRYEGDSFDKFSLEDKRKRTSYRVYDLKGNILYENITGRKNLKKILGLKGGYSGFSVGNLFTKKGNLKVLEDKYVVVNSLDVNSFIKVENLLKNKDILGINKVCGTVKSRISNIKEIVVLTKNQEYIIFDSIIDIKIAIQGLSLSRHLTPYLISACFYKSELFFLHNQKKFINCNVSNIENKLKIKLNPFNFQEIKDIVRTIGKPMTIEEFLAKIQ